MSDRAKVLKEFARKLDDLEFNDFEPSIMFAEAKERGIVILYNIHPMTCVLKGAIHSETDCYVGKIAFIDSTGFSRRFYFTDPEERFSYKNWKENKDIEFRIKCNSEGNPYWRYETKIPHEKFDVYEDGELFCEGIIFYADELKQG